MTVVEENGDRRTIIGSFPSLYLGEREVRVAGAVAVDVDVPGQVEGRGQHHHAGVVHPLAVLPLPGGQVGQPSLLTNKDDIDHILLDFLWQVTEMIADLQTRVELNKQLQHLQ